MKIKSISLTITALLFTAGVCAEETLCDKGDVVTFSCHIGKKIVSICNGNREKPLELEYRFGIPSKVEFSISHIQGKFTQKYSMYC